MKKLSVAVLFLSLGIFASASAGTIHGINMDFVAIGHAGNMEDTTGYGAVSYNYSIGKYEVTNAQWNIFVSLADAPTGSNIGYGYGSVWTGSLQPAGKVSWFEAAQFCNYLTSGDKSKGVYQFSGNNTNAGSFLGVDRTAAQANYGTIYVLPTENEWYKAAYYKSSGNGYSLYANGLSTIPAADNGWNYYPGAYSTLWNVGTGTQEQNGTYDMMGNAWEWTEAIAGNYCSGLHGGDIGSGSYALISSFRLSSLYAQGDGNIGFRVVCIVPEPASLLLLGLGGMALRIRKK